MDRDPSPGATAHVSLERADAAQRAVIDRLCQLERHDLSRLMGWLPDGDGLFEVPSVDRFFTEPGHGAYVIRADGALAGFALTRPLAEGPHFVHSFFVVRALRREGVGREAARLLLQEHPGPWAIAWLDTYEEAGRFWRVVAGDAAGTGWTESRRTSPDGEHEFAWIEIGSARVSE